MRLDPITNYLLSEQDNKIHIKIINDIKDLSPIKKDLLRLWKMSAEEDNKYLKRFDLKLRKVGEKDLFEKLTYSIGFGIFLSDKLVGIAFIKEDHQNSGYMYLNDLIINPEERGKRIGSMLMDSIIKYCKQKNKKGIALTVWEGNDRAMNLYSRLGFKDIYKCMKKSLKNE